MWITTADVPLHGDAHNRINRTSKRNLKQDSLGLMNCLDWCQDGRGQVFYLVGTTADRQVQQAIISVDWWKLYINLPSWYGCGTWQRNVFPLILFRAQPDSLRHPLLCLDCVEGYWLCLHRHFAIFNAFLTKLHIFSHRCTPLSCHGERPLKPGSLYSRRREWQADRWTIRMEKGRVYSLVSSLQRNGFLPPRLLMFLAGQEC